jgi:hypothetical protein
VYSFWQRMRWATFWAIFHKLIWSPCQGDAQRLNIFTLCIFNFYPIQLKNSPLFLHICTPFTQSLAHR